MFKVKNRCLIARYLASVLMCTCVLSACSDDDNPLPNLVNDEQPPAPTPEPDPEPTALPPVMDTQIKDQDGVLRADIRYTTNGVPHIMADTLEEMGFGQGYAQARDNICIIADEVLRARSERAAFFGPGPGSINVITDFSYKALGIYAKAEAEFTDLSASSQAILNGFAAGYNKYLNDESVDALTDMRCAGQPWVRPITGTDIHAHHQIVALYASGHNFATGVTFLAAPPGADPSPVIASHTSEKVTHSLIAKLRGHLEARVPISVAVQHDQMGSNGWGIGSEMAENGRGALLANPHFPYTGARRFWQSHVTVPGVINANGAGLIGTPVPQITFNQHLAWTHTVSAADRFAVYQLTLEDGDMLSYIKDGESVAIEPRTLQIDVADGTGGTVVLEKTFYFSEYGPMIAANAINPAFPAWGDPLSVEIPFAAFTYRDANENTASNFYDQWLDMGRSTNLAQFQSVFENCGGTYWVNTIYADADGNASYIDSSAVPRFSEDALTAFAARRQASPLLQAAFDDGLPVFDGSTSRDDWVEGECGLGIVPFSEAPSITRSDFVQNSNDSYWLTHPASPETGLSPLYGEVEVEQNLRTRLGLTMLLNPTDSGAAASAPAGEDGLFNAVELIETIYNNRTYYGEFAGVREALAQRCDAIADEAVMLPDGSSRSVAQGCAAIQAWDGMVNVDSTGAHTFRIFIDQYDDTLPDSFANAFDVADPVNTPNTPVAPAESLSQDPILRLLAVALNILDDAGIAYDAALGDIQAVQKSSNVLPGGVSVPLGARIPWHGGPGGDEGAFNAVSVVAANVADNTRFPRVSPADTSMNSGGLSTSPGEGYLIGHGASWHFGLEFTENGPLAYGLLSYSQSTNPASDHFSDQDMRYSNKNYRKLLFTEEDIQNDPELMVLTITDED